MENSYVRLLRAARLLGKADNAAEVARLIGVSDQTIQNWKTRGVPDSQLLKIEEKIGAVPKWIVTGEGDMTKLIQVGVSNLTAEQERMIALMSRIGKPEQDALLRLASLLPADEKKIGGRRIGDQRRQRENTVKVDRRQNLKTYKGGQ